MYPIKKHSKISTDPRNELLSTVIFLSEFKNDRFINKSKNEYTDKIRERFASYKNHPAVQKYPEMWEMDLCWDGVPNLAIHLTDNFTLLKDVQFSKDLQPRFKDNFKVLEEYVKLLKDFADNSHFMEFYTKSQNDDVAFFSKLNETYNNNPVIEVLEDYIQLTLPEKSIFISRLLKSSFGAVRENPHERHIYCIASAYWLKVAMKNRCIELNFLSTIWHEFLHSVINPLTDALFEAPFDLSDAELEWYCALNESIIWALCLRLLIGKKKVDPNNLDWYFTNAVRNSAPKTREMNELLIEYEENRARYKDITEFYHILQKKFGDVPR